MTRSKDMKSTYQQASLGRLVKHRDEFLATLPAKSRRRLKKKLKIAIKLREQQACD